MMPPDDIELLRRWTESRSEAAFRQLVEQYGPLVWGVALRKTGDHGLAEEAAQNVFIDLARKAPALLESRRSLAAWLHRAALFEAAQVLRREIRHRERMKHALLPSGAAQEDPWETIRPHLDDAIGALSETDRRVLLLHWFERRTFADVASALGCSPAAAQRRGLRALDKLAASLRQRGVIAQTAVLGAGLTSTLVTPLPGSIISALTSLAPSSAPAGLALSFQKSLYVMASAKPTTAAVMLIAAAIPISLRLGAPNERPSAIISSGTSPSTAKQGSPALSASARRDTANLLLIQQALAKLLANPDDYQTELDLRRLMFALQEEEIPDVLALFMKAPSKKRDVLHETCLALFARWAELNSMEAITAAKKAKSAYGFAPLRGAFVTWAAADLETAWQWLEKDGEEADRNFLGGEALAAQVHTRDSGRSIMQRVDTMSDKKWQRELRFWVLRAWSQVEGAKTDQQGGPIEWAAHLPEEADRAHWLGEALELLGVSDFSAALAVTGRIENQARREEVMFNILWPWLLERPKEAYAELEKHLGDWPQDLFRFAGDALTRNDPHAALAAAQRLPAGPVRDDFVNGMFTGVLYCQNAAALLPAMSLISDEELNSHGGLTTFTEVLAKQNPAAAAEWLASLPEGSRTRLFAEGTFKTVTGKSAAAFSKSFAK